METFPSVEIIVLNEKDCNENPSMLKKIKKAVLILKQC